MHTVRRFLVAASLLALLGLMVGGSLDSNEERSPGALMPTAVEYAVML
jgi:hypothetical protein